MHRKEWIALLTVTFTLCSTMVAIAASAQQSTNSVGMEAGSVWSYHVNNYEIYNPQIAQDNKGLVFVRKLHAPDGHEAEMYSKKELKQFADRVKVNPRIEDPEVVFMNIADNSIRVIDYGWEPVFSSDGKKILYAHQKQPISGYRVLASTLEGNEIREHDLSRNLQTPVARPSGGYLSKPAFTDMGAVLFAMSDAVNGAWGGDIAVVMADPTGQQKALYEEVLYAPVIEHDLYHLVRKFAMRDGDCLVLRARPLTTGRNMADLYAYELVDAKKQTLLYSWGEHRHSPVEADFRICPSGRLEVYDGAWKVPALGETEPRAPSPAGHSSPDCAYVAAVSEDQETLTIFSSQGEAEHRWNAPGVIRFLTWSPDASHVALVISHGGVDVRFDFDELIVLRVSDMPTYK
jgi:hypothetical protein